MRFNVGDRVRVVKAYDHLDVVVGTEGTVCAADHGMIGVNHDIADDVMHNCNGDCPLYHGWFYFADSECLEKIDAEPPHIDTLDDLV